MSKKFTFYSYDYEIILSKEYIRKIFIEHEISDIGEIDFRGLLKVKHIEDDAFDELINLKYIKIPATLYQLLNPRIIKYLDKLVAINIIFDTDNSEYHNEELNSNNYNFNTDILKNIKELLLTNNSLFSYLSNEGNNLPIKLINLFNLEAFTVSGIKLLPSAVDTIYKIINNNVKLKAICLNECDTDMDIDKDMFKNNINLNNLILFAIKLNKLDKDAFKYNINLSNIQINGNSLTNLHKDIFKYNINLKKIDIKYNTLSELDENIFKHNIKLKEINMKFNSLSVLDKNIFRFNTELEVLNISCNLINYIDPNLFIGLDKLHTLYLNNNKLKKIPFIIDNCIKLTELDLSNNNITVLPPVLKNIKKLNVSKNPIKLICNVIFKDLEILNIQNTDIKRLLFNNKYKLYNLKEICISSVSNINYIDKQLQDYIKKSDNKL
jgi:hypothetical protein